MANGSLLAWASAQPSWVQDALRRLAASPSLRLSENDLTAIGERVAAEARCAEPLPCEPLSDVHLDGMAAAGPRTIFASIGPVAHIDRLAGEQTLRFAKSGITLIYGENGSGKSGYARIARRLCRSLAPGALKGDVFSTVVAPPTVTVTFQAGDADELRPFQWKENEPPPEALRQISVFDTESARLYVDGRNRIAYLPAELAILEHHGQTCIQLNSSFQAEQEGIEKRIKTPLQGGYTPGGVVHALLDRLNPKNADLPTKADLDTLAGLNEAEEAELCLLEKVLATDPGALAAHRRRAATALSAQGTSLAQVESGLSAAVGDKLKKLIVDYRVRRKEAALAAAAAFNNEPLPKVGSEPWRALYDAAVAYVAHASGKEKLPDATGDPCPLCQEGMSAAAANRLARFNAFVSGETAKAADAAKAELDTAVAAIAAVAIPQAASAGATLLEYGSISAARAAVVDDVKEAFSAYENRRKSLLSSVEADEFTAPEPPKSLAQTLKAELVALETEAAELDASADDGAGLEAERKRLSSLKDRKKLKDDLAPILARLADLTRIAELKACRAQVATGKVSTQINAMRRKMVADGLQDRINGEISRLNLGHIPFHVSDFSDHGKSLFKVSLMGVERVQNSEILSEGEQRALALACFLAETAGAAENFGLIIDDPVSSLDHTRMRLVAERLVEEAGKGRQVVIFTHSLVFFNEVVAVSARSTPPVPLVKSVVRRTDEQGFGVIEEDVEPWISKGVNERLIELRDRARVLESETDLASDAYRRKVKDFYTDLRETWERLVEEVIFNKTVERLNPEVKTQSLKGVVVEDDDYRKIYFAMKKVSERSGHDMAVGKAIPAPKTAELLADLKEISDYRDVLNKRRKQTQERRTELEKPPKAEFAG